MKAITDFGAEHLELRLQFVGQMIDILLVGLIVAFETICETRRHQAERRRQDRLVQRAPHHVAARAERAKRVAMIALSARDEVGALGLTNLDEVLARKLQRSLGAFRAGGAEVRVRQTAGFAVQHDVREVLGRLAAERAGVGVGHGGRLAADGLGDAAVAVAEAGNGGAAGTIDDARAVGLMQVDPLAAGGERGRATGAMQDAGCHGVVSSAPGQRHAFIVTTRREPQSDHASAIPSALADCRASDSFIFVPTHRALAGTRASPKAQPPSRR